jgi:hypothetical protein
MMLRERQIPPQPGWPFQLNKKFPDLSKAGIRIPIKPATLAPSPKGDGKIKLALNSFDASVSFSSTGPSFLRDKYADAVTLSRAAMSR